MSLTLDAYKKHCEQVNIWGYGDKSTPVRCAALLSKWGLLHLFKLENSEIFQRSVGLVGTINGYTVSLWPGGCELKSHVSGPSGVEFGSWAWPAAKEEERLEKALRLELSAAEWEG